MSRYRMTVTVEVDDLALALHDNPHLPPPPNVEDWYGGDLLAAVAACIAEVDHAPIEVEREEDETE